MFIQTQSWIYRTHFTVSHMSTSAFKAHWSLWTNVIYQSFLKHLIQLTETLLQFYSAFPSTWLQVIKTVMPHLTYIKRASRRVLVKKQFYFLIYLLFISFATKSSIIIQEFLLHSWSSKLCKSNELRQEEGKVEKTRWTACRWALVNTRRKSEGKQLRKLCKLSLKIRYYRYLWICEPA